MSSPTCVTYIMNYSITLVSLPPPPLLCAPPRNSSGNIRAKLLATPAPLVFVFGCSKPGRLTCRTTTPRVVSWISLKAFWRQPRENAMAVRCANIKLIANLARSVGSSKHQADRTHALHASLERRVMMRARACACGRHFDSVTHLMYMCFVRARIAQHPKFVAVACARSQPGHVRCCAQPSHQITIDSLPKASMSNSERYGQMYV